MGINKTHEQLLDKPNQKTELDDGGTVVQENFVRKDGI